MVDGHRQVVQAPSPFCIQNIFGSAIGLLLAIGQNNQAVGRLRRQIEVMQHHQCYPLLVARLLVHMFHELLGAERMQVPTWVGYMPTVKVPLGTTGR